MSPRFKTLLVGLEIRRFLPGRKQGAQRRRRSRVLDDAGHALGESQHLAQPFEDRVFELGGRRRGLPDHALSAEPGRQQLAQDGGRAVIGRKIGVPPGMLPVRDTREDDGLEVGEDAVHGLGLRGRFGGDLGLDLARIKPGHDRQILDVFHIIGEPIDEFMAIPPE